MLGLCHLTQDEARVTVAHSLHGRFVVVRFLVDLRSLAMRFCISCSIVILGTLKQMISQDKTKSFIYTGGPDSKKECPDDVVAWLARCQLTRSGSRRCARQTWSGSGERGDSHGERKRRVAMK
jgi:hypothetical protein